MVIGFYGVSPFDTGGYPMSMTEVYSWGDIGVVTGWVLAAISQFPATRVVAAPWPWTLGCCSILVVAHLAVTAYLGWVVIEVTTASGVVSIGASTADVVASTAVLVASSGVP